MRLMSIIALFALAFGIHGSPSAPVVPQEPAFAYAPIVAGWGWVATAHHLYLTRTDGRAWQEITPPLGDDLLMAADFVAGGSGWVVSGHPSGDGLSALTLARTADFGAHWQAAPLALYSEGDVDSLIGRVALDFTADGAGVLAVRHASSSNFNRWSEWWTADGGATWVQTRRAEERADEDLSEVGVVWDDASAGAVTGWQLAQNGRCSAVAGRRICEQSTSLRATDDGGRSWHAISLPVEVETARQTIPVASVSAAAAQGTLVAVGQGFDKCEVPTLDQLYTWRWSSPYSSVNLYIGGSARACRNYALNPDFLRSAFDMGWTFIPTWVGPQAPCTTYKSRISYDPVAARGEGWREANAASDTLAALGLTEPDGSGSIVYYDMEAYSTGDSACNAAVQSFIAGWDEALHARGHLAGVYGTGSTLNLLAGLSPAPDAIWAAHWFKPYQYRPDATVWGVYKLSDDVWSNDQRLRQYAGGHAETWGDLTMTIDSNVLDGPVAQAGPALTPTPSATPTVTPTPTATPTATATRVPITPTAWMYLPLVVR